MQTEVEEIINQAITGKNSAQLFTVIDQIFDLAIKDNLDNSEVIHAVNCLHIMVCTRIAQYLYLEGGRSYHRVIKDVTKHMVKYAIEVAKKNQANETKRCEQTYTPEQRETYDTRTEAIFGKAWLGNYKKDRSFASKILKLADEYDFSEYDMIFVIGQIYSKLYNKQIKKFGIEKTITNYKSNIKFITEFNEAVLTKFLKDGKIESISDSDVKVRPECINPQYLTFTQKEEWQIALELIRSTILHMIQLDKKYDYIAPEDEIQDIKTINKMKKLLHQFYSDLYTMEINELGDVKAKINYESNIKPIEKITIEVLNKKSLDSLKNIINAMYNNPQHCSNILDD